MANGQLQTGRCTVVSLHAVVCQQDNAPFCHHQAERHVSCAAAVALSAAVAAELMAAILRWRQGVGVLWAAMARQYSCAVDGINETHKSDITPRINYTRDVQQQLRLQGS